ncbi:MAG TPA: hypothetical protein VFB13_17615 [Reyranella sp.]|jgi:GNAT superfamily N-acetyltransferase|nr:hypothetical protein [Reyranella sp.]
MKPRKPKRGRREAVHVRIYFWERESAAWQSLSPAARCVLIELKALYNGRNNGSLFLSVREAARRAGIGKTLAARCFRDLIDRGFTKIAQKGAFNIKAASRRGDATAWLLTEFPHGDETGVGTKDFMRWRPITLAAQNSVDGPPRSTRCAQ